MKIIKNCHLNIGFPLAFLKCNINFTTNMLWLKLSHQSPTLSTQLWIHGSSCSAIHLHGMLCLCCNWRRNHQGWRCCHNIYWHCPNHHLHSHNTSGWKIHKISPYSHLHNQVENPRMLDLFFVHQAPPDAIPTKVLMCRLNKDMTWQWHWHYLVVKTVIPSLDISLWFNNILS